MRRSTSASQACGSTLLSLAVVISVYIAGARSPPRSGSAKSQFLRPIAPGNSAHVGQEVEAHYRAPGVQGAVTGDLSTIAGARIVADQANNLGRFDAFWDHGYAQHNPINDLSRPSPRDPSHDPASDKYEKKSSKCDALHTAPSVVDSN
jgi:hypothetical protein